MKTTVRVKKEIEIKTIKVDIAVRYEDEEIPYDFPLRRGDRWCAEIDIDSGVIKDWPQGKSGVLAMKVRDEGTYTLFDADGQQVAELADEYVPNRLIPGEYGDYIELSIDETGKITNWPKKPNVEAFFPCDED